MPRLQEKGTRPASALPCRAEANISVNKAENNLRISFGATPVGNRIYAKPGKDSQPASHNAQTATGLPFAVYSMSRCKGQLPLPRYYAVAAGDHISDKWDLSDFDNNNYHLRVYGPNGFFREFRGTITNNEPVVDFLETDNGVRVKIANTTSGEMSFTITDRYNKNNNQSLTLQPAEEKVLSPDVSKHQGWHELAVALKTDRSFIRLFAGRNENGKHGITDPVMGGMI